MLPNAYLRVPAAHQAALATNGVVDCSNEVFTDPLPGRPKQCECCEGAGCPSLDSPCEGNDWRCNGADEATCHDLQASGVECSWGNGDTAAVCPTRTCSGSGDPHYTAFSGRRFDFQGECEYRLVSSVCSTAAPVDGVGAPFAVAGPAVATTADAAGSFEVQVRNVGWGGRGSSRQVSITGAMAVMIPGVQGVVEFYERHNGGIQFNGTPLHVPSTGVQLLSTKGDQVVVKPNGK